MIRAVEFAKSIGMTSIGITGFDGGKLKSLSDVSVHIPVDDMGMTEALHAVVLHLAMSQLRDRLDAAGWARRSTAGYCFWQTLTITRDQLFGSTRHRVSSRMRMRPL